MGFSTVKTGRVNDPSGTLMLVERPDPGNVAGSVYVSVTDSADDCAANAPAGFHNGRLGWLFVDGHVDGLKLGQTIGRGTTANPLGDWTVATGD